MAPIKPGFTSTRESFDITGIESPNDVVHTQVITQAFTSPRLQEPMGVGLPTAIPLDWALLTFGTNTKKTKLLHTRLDPGLQSHEKRKTAAQEPCVSLRVHCLVWLKGIYCHPFLVSFAAEDEGPFRPQAVPTLGGGGVSLERLASRGGSGFAGRSEPNILGPEVNPPLKMAFWFPGQVCRRVLGCRCLGVKIHHEGRLGSVFFFPPAEFSARCGAIGQLSGMRPVGTSQLS